MRREAKAREHLDGPVSPEAREASLADVDRLNAWFGGHALTLEALRRLLPAPSPGGPPLLVADIGGGRGDLARRLAPATAASLRVVLVDRDAETLARGAVSPGVFRVCADATALPFREGTVDVVTTTLMLHHLAPDEAVACLEAMRTAARAGVVVNDLLRTRLALAMVWLATRLVARHPISRHDGPLSVRRAYSPAELRVLCEKAGWRRFSVRRHPWLARILVTAW
jgi:ubiquinone/menaquinone biosynthesis C-methylase UbiE